MKIIFLDIDGVLNSDVFFASNHEEVKQFYKDNKYDSSDVQLMVKRQMMDIDFDKLEILKKVIIETNSQVVITSSWKKLKIFSYIMNELIKLGIPIIGYTIDNGSDRGSGIKKYLIENQVDNYVILDDDIFDDYDEELLNKLVKTSFFADGLTKEHGKELIKRLKK